MTTQRFPIALVFAAGLAAIPTSATAAEIPFSGINIIDGDFDDALCVYAADVDGDGDLDVLGAAHIPGEVTWWENTQGDGSGWYPHAVSTSFPNAIFVRAI